MEPSPVEFTSAAEVSCALPLDKLFAEDLFCIVIIVRSAKQPQVVFGISPSTGKRHNMIDFQVPGAGTNAILQLRCSVPDIGQLSVKKIVAFFKKVATQNDEHRSWLEVYAHRL